MIEFIFPPTTELPPFKPDYGSAENVSSGPDIDLLKRFLERIMPTVTRIKVHHTKRYWESRSSFVEHWAVVEVWKSAKAHGRPYLIVLKGGLCETSIAIYEAASRSSPLEEPQRPVATWSDKPLPNAEEIWLAERGR